MLKASALYIVIVIAMVIAVLCFSLIASAYFYRLQYQKTVRSEQLQDNLVSAQNILLSNDDTAYSGPKTFSLFNNNSDSVSTQKLLWGVFDIGVIKSFIQTDTLYKVFSFANTIDSSKWAAIYLADDNRPLSISGNTSIIGNLFLPKTGINRAAIDNQPFNSNNSLFIGKRANSSKDLPKLDTIRLLRLERFLAQSVQSATAFPSGDSIQRSFLSPPCLITVKDKVTTLENIKLSGNIIIYSDTLLNISNTARLTNVIIFAKSVNIQSGFQGNCQIFARDSISIEKNCSFNYPSCLGILRFKGKSKLLTEAKINLYGESVFKGFIFAYDEQQIKIPPLIHIGTGVKVCGQIYSPGYVEFENNAEVDGAVFTAQFLFKTRFNLYQNYLNNVTINSKLLSPYYLTSPLHPVADKRKKILQWLELN